MRVLPYMTTLICSTVRAIFAGAMLTMILSFSGAVVASGASTMGLGMCYSNSGPSDPCFTCETRPNPGREGSGVSSSRHGGSNVAGLRKVYCERCDCDTDERCRRMCKKCEEVEVDERDDSDGIERS